MKPVLVTSGEPAGIGPDICLALAATGWPVVVMGDKSLLAKRAKKLGISLNLVDYRKNNTSIGARGSLTVLPLPCLAEASAGVLNPDNAKYVMQMLGYATERCLQGEFSALVTAPVHKGVINQGGYSFSGHTEFLAASCGIKTVVMMLASTQLRVALATTHLPLKEVPLKLTKTLLTDVIHCLHEALRKDFGIEHPKICVAGLNPHAGEGGYLGKEEIEVITPVLNNLRQEGLSLFGPLPADTMFSASNLQSNDVFLAMYHDQGLPVIKYADFGRAVNITLGLPFIRTSVDHGTALELAGTGLADASSLLAAVEMAINVARNRSSKKR
ncbi:4-hydroxythreonine-4-phosphate dehydrogenase PdxA [Legionella londiniensis]|uniref:4-hydroxythreonine-4-phosphate dehydrogenase n=1 Tax=Legionella londiniensis TaxID=45068 RepID=A0A0W0VIK8_9GAMM|nr:4-hydroxythreonine-4-phosphate dehydrogenase PdxA [Legionella londiniensis]KTD19943.1 4-hydroxythreonine-4-phosphate dehydrogenase [Legionella londiniensis]STX94184.1 4-hydroxythreonine-4-phosphate dehydrogenase [Legionella londiniensis]